MVTSSGGSSSSSDASPISTVAVGWGTVGGICVVESDLVRQEIKAEAINAAFIARKRGVLCLDIGIGSLPPTTTSDAVNKLQIGYYKESVAIATHICCHIPGENLDDLEDGTGMHSARSQKL